MSSFSNNDINEKSKWHEEEIMTSQPYRQSINYMHNLIEDFRKGLYVTSLAYSREGSYKDSAL